MLKGSKLAALVLAAVCALLLTAPTAFADSGSTDGCDPSAQSCSTDPADPPPPATCPDGTGVYGVDCPVVDPPVCVTSDTSGSSGSVSSDSSGGGDSSGATEDPAPPTDCLPIDVGSPPPPDNCTVSDDRSAITCSWDDGNGGTTSGPAYGCFTLADGSVICTGGGDGGGSGGPISCGADSSSGSDGTATYCPTATGCHKVGEGEVVCFDGIPLHKHPQHKGRRGHHRKAVKRAKAKRHRASHRHASGHRAKTTKRHHAR